jgi:hypothetical protein
MKNYDLESRTTRRYLRALVDASSSVPPGGALVATWWLARSSALNAASLTTQPKWRRRGQGG